MITKDSIIDAYVFLRVNDCSIPSETLDFMKEASLKALEELEKLNEELIKENKRITKDFYKMEKELLNMDAVINKSIKSENELLKKQNEELIKIIKDFSRFNKIYEPYMPNDHSINKAIDKLMEDVNKIIGE